METKIIKTKRAVFQTKGLIVVVYTNNCVNLVYEDKTVIEIPVKNEKDGLDIIDGIYSCWSPSVEGGGNDLKSAPYRYALGDTVNLFGKVYVVTCLDGGYFLAAYATDYNNYQMFIDAGIGQERRVDFVKSIVPYGKEDGFLGGNFPEVASLRDLGRVIDRLKYIEAHPEEAF